MELRKLLPGRGTIGSDRLRDRNEGMAETPSPIAKEELSAWMREPIQTRVQDNIQRVAQHVVDFERVAQAPLAPASAKKYMVVFLHVPKTGGTTVEYVLSKNYRINGVIHINAPALAANPLSLFKKGVMPHVVMGHHTLATSLYYFVDRPLVHFTMLRDPVRRVLSYFDYLQTSTGHALHDKAAARSLEQFVEGRDMVELANAQTLRISGNLQKRWWEKTDMEDAFARAKHSLENHFTLFGLTERYPEFLIMARQVLGWADIYHQRMNVSQRKTRPEDVPESVLERIKERNAYDIALYDHACGVFEARCRRLRIGDTKVRTFHERNAAYQELIETGDF